MLEQINKECKLDLPVEECGADFKDRMILYNRLRINYTSSILLKLCNVLPV